MKGEIKMGWSEDHRECVSERMAKKIKIEGEEKIRKFLVFGGWSEYDVKYIIRRAKQIAEKQ